MIQSSTGRIIRNPKDGKLKFHTTGSPEQGKRNFHYANMSQSLSTDPSGSMSQTGVSNRVTRAGGSLAGGGISYQGGGWSGGGGVDVFSPYLYEIFTHAQLCNMYHDIYLNDPLASAAANMYAKMPFSDFKLTTPDEKIAEKYEEAISAMQFNTLLPQMALESLVFGASVSMIIHDENRNIVGTIPFPFGNCEVRSSPPYGNDPIIRVKVSKEMREYFKDPSPQVQETVRMIGPEMVDLLKNEDIDLQPLTTIYFPRPTFSFTDMGTSLYRGILPIYLLEKVRYRITLIMANRRQAPMKHLSAGSDEWQPTPAEMQTLTNMLINADLDPMGSVVTTPQDVEISDIPALYDFWKWQDIIQELNHLKLQAMGINDSFLSGDMTYSNLETALQVFLETLSDFRNNFTFNVLYNRLFPLISYAHGFTKAKYSGSDSAKKDAMEENARILGGFGRRSIRRRMAYVPEGMDVHNIDVSGLIIPKVDWVKRLTPRMDETKFDLYDRMTDLNIPVSLKAYATAGEFDLEDMIDQREDEIPLKVRMAEVELAEQEALAKVGAEDDDPGGDENIFGWTAARAKKQGFGSRLNTRRWSPDDFPEEMSTIVDSNGRPYYNQKRAHGKFKDKMATAIRNLDEKANRQYSVSWFDKARDEANTDDIELGD